MKRIHLVLVACAVLIGSRAVAQNAASGTAGAPQQQQKLVKVATINSADGVREFERNVQILQAQRQGVLELKTQVDKETNAKKKKELQSKLDAAVKKLDENNALMTKNYGFSLARNYTMEINSATIYMAVTDQEAANIEQAQREQAKGKK